MKNSKKPTFADVASNGTRITQREIPLKVYTYDESFKSKIEVVPAGTQGTIVSHKWKREGSYRYVDYTVRWDNGVTSGKAGVEVDRQLGLNGL